MDQNKKKEYVQEELKKADERKKAKLKDEIGITNVQSRFMEDSKVIVNREQSEVKVIEEINRRKDKNQGNGGRGNSVSILKTMSSTTNFDSSQSVEISRIYQSSTKRDKS